MESEQLVNHDTQPVTIMMAPELLAQMCDTWSPPVQLHVHRGTDGGWEMTARTHQCHETCTCIDTRTVVDDGPVLIPGMRPCPIHQRPKKFGE